MMTHEEWQALVEDSRHEPWDFFPRHGGMKVAGRWRFPRAWVWWDSKQDWWHVRGRNGWKVRCWGRLADEEIVEEFGVRAWSRAARLALWCMEKSK